MTIQIPGSALHTGYQSDSAMNQFPYRSPALEQTGIYAQSINLIDVTMYDIDIFANWVSHKPQETPFYSMLSFLGQGDLINTFQYHWWDEYEGTGMIDTGLYNLRTRDGLGSAVSGVPFAIGAEGEIGGKLIFNKCYALSGGIRYTNKWSTYLANSCDIEIRTAGTGYAAGDTNMVPADSESVVEIQEITPQTIGSNKFVSLGFKRPASGKYAYITGNVANYINQMRSSLLAQNYTLESFTGCTWNGTGSKTIYSIKYTAGTSFAFMGKFDQLATLEMTDHDSGIFDQKVVVNVKVDRFIFSEDADSFIIVYDFATSNEEFTSNSAVLASALDASGNDGWWMCTKSTVGSENLVNATTIYIGDIFRFDQGVDTWTTAAPSNNNEYVKVNTGLLMEQVNSAATWTSTTTWNGTDRLFGYLRGSASTMSGGQTYLSKYGIINMFHDTGSAVSESEGFSVEEQPGYTFTQEGKYNWVEFYNGKPYGITTARQEMKLGFGGHGKDNFTVLREREMTKAKKIMQNKCLWGKKSNTSASTTDSAYKGTMSGLLDAEMFDIPYLSIPLPVYNGQVLYYSDGGLMIQEWFERIAKSVNYNASTGKWEGSTRQVFISLTIRNYIRRTMSFLGSANNTTGNVLGTQFRSEKITNGEATFGLEVDKVKTSYGDLTLIYDPSLDQDTTWKLPRYKFAHRNGEVRPRWLIFIIDKASIKLKTFANRTPKIYGNLQPSNNPFVYKEGFSAAQTLEVRNESNHAIIDATPNNV